MKILHIIQRYWPYEGGSEGVFKDNSERLAAAGHDVTVYTSDAWDIESLWSKTGRRVPKREEEHNGVKIHRFSPRYLPRHQGTSKLFSLLPSKRARMFGAHPCIWMPKLWKEASRKNDFDVVTAGVLPYDVFLQVGLEISRRGRIPFVAWPMIHFGIPKVDAVNNPFLTPDRMALVKQADHVLVNSMAETPVLVKHGIQREKISQGGIGVDPRQVWGGRGEQFRKKHRISSPIVLQLSKQILDKGSQHTVEAMKLLWKRGCDAMLVLAGQVTENFDAYWFEQPPDVLERTLLLDYVDTQEKKDLLDACDVFVMPSKADSFGIVYCEAWLYKKPVVGAYAGGVTALIEDGTDGMLVPYGDPHFLAETLKTLLDNASLRSQMGESGYRKTLKEYTWDVQYLYTLKVYEELVGSS